MRLCVFSDVHGNGPAFKAAYPKILAERADVNIFLGDLCGYYYDQLEIFSILRELPNLIALIGNHDCMFLDIVKGDRNFRERYLRKYGCSIDNLLTMEFRELADWLSSLPEAYEDRDNHFSCFHGSPLNLLEGYVYPDSPMEFFLGLPKAFFFLGHTHYKMSKSVGDTIIVNPGSLGQPRDSVWPTYAVVELSSGLVSFREVIYDKAALKRKIQEMGNTRRYLKDVLDRQPR